MSRSPGSSCPIVRIDRRPGLRTLHDRARPTGDRGRRGRLIADRGRIGAMAHENLLATPTPPPTYLPEEAEATAARSSGADPASVAWKFPSFCAAWADLAEQAMTKEPPDPVAAYAYARTGYHRGLDQLRRAG